MKRRFLDFEKIANLFGGGYFSHSVVGTDWNDFLFQFF